MPFADTVLEVPMPSTRPVPAAILAALVGVASLTVARAEPWTIGAPLLSEGRGDKPVQSDGATFVNHGLVGVGRQPPGQTDFLGDTLGSISGMAIRDWRRDGEGYRGTLYTLPDRGRNAPEDDLFSDYQGRLIGFDLAFVPNTSLTFTPTGKGIALTDLAGQPTTGADPGHGVVTQGGHALPSPATGQLGAGHVSLDAEAVAFRPDGSFYVGDEYAAAIYLFGPDGRMQGMIGPEPALAPMTGGKLDFNSSKAPDTGRRNNQGMEAVALTPDGKTLVAVLQSATLQDSSASKDQVNRANTRILVYDVLASPLPGEPKAVHALTLPTFASKGDGTIDRTAAQSEVVALDDHRFLVLARDGIGRGCDCKGREIVKAVLLVDTAGATNLAGTDYARTTKPIAPAEGDRNVLDPAIKPASSRLLVNLLNPDDLGRFGLNIRNEALDANTLSEKWEAMALVPALDPKAPDDVFLFIGNDNDFEAKSGVMQGKPYQGKIDNDNVLLAYRLTLPGIEKRD
jgi:hypothetical protein